VSKFNAEGEWIRNELWDAGNDAVDEEDVYEDGEECALDGGDEDANPWPEGSPAYNTWLDGYQSIFGD